MQRGFHHGLLGDQAARSAPRTLSFRRQLEVFLETAGFGAHHHAALAFPALFRRIGERTAAALAACGGSPAAFGGRCIPAGGVTPPLHIPDMRGRRALPSGRLTRLGATLGFHHELLDSAVP